MEQVIEKELALSKVLVQLATARWAMVEESTPALSGGYFICQRLSDDHSALKIGNLTTKEAFPRVRSVGCLPPGHSVRLYPLGKPFRALLCTFEKAYFESTTEFEADQWSEDTGAFVNIQNKRLETVMQQIHAELVEPGFAHSLLIEAASSMILVEMARYGRQRLGKTKAKSGGQGLVPWQLRRIRERIEASTEIGYPSLSELSSICGISQSHLMRSFKASTGWQLHKYIAEERLNAAKLMLAEDQISSKEISARLGFCSPAYFATAFLRTTGMTPTDFRRRTRVPQMGNA
jgi:AraC family transcriptional regulator